MFDTGEAEPLPSIVAEWSKCDPGSVVQEIDQSVAKQFKREVTVMERPECDPSSEAQQAGQSVSDHSEHVRTQGKEYSKHLAQPELGTKPGE